MTVSARTPAQVVLGVTGGIAAYKSADLVRRLVRNEIEVQVVMTPSAEQFVTPLTFQALSGRAVRSTLFDPAAEAAMGHIELARWADLILIAPASANTIAHLAQGQAGNLLTTTVLASAAPLAIAPAMNQQMWAHPATIRNIATLRGDGVHIWGPGSGDQACGDTGDGRMLEPEELSERVHSELHPKSLRGRTVLITAGPTREAIDPVRYISNHSSGKQGYALANAAAAAGARVVLVSGPVDLATPPGVTRIDVNSAEEMLGATIAHATEADIFIAVAAVADYRVANVAQQKIKKVAGAPAPDLQLVQNPDIAQSVAALPNRPFCVGFAAETDNVIDHARDKLERKALDLIIANDVSDTTIGFGSDVNAVTILWRGGELELPAMPKPKLAHQMIDIIRDHHDNNRRGHVSQSDPTAP